MSTESTESTEGLREIVEDLRERVAELEARLDERPDHHETMAGVSDQRDAAVVDALETGDVVGPRRLQRLYNRHTDVQNKTTLRNRIKNLTTDGPFEHVAHSQWRYTGGDRDE